MTTSGTITFNPPIDDIIEEAYERTNIRGTRSGYQLKSARRSLNILFSEWANRGVHLWEIKEATVPLVQGQAVDRSAYAALPNKLTQGTPSQYYVQRLIAPTISLYATPSASFSGANFQLKFYYMARIQDAGAYTNTADVVYRFYPCMISGLAYYLSVKYSPERTQELRMMYEDEFARALNEDSQGTSSFISPQTFYGDGV